MKALPEEPQGDLALLRSLLLRPEQVELDSLKERLENPDLHAQDVSRVLAEAILLRAREGDELARALQPVIVAGMRTAVLEDPGFVADAIYPIIGPAIRKAIAHALREFTRSLNATLNDVFSLRGLKWRWEAWRTRRPLAEVVMRHQLVFQVEQVFLIHRVTGLVLQHVARSEVDSEDPTLVGAMLSAINEYMRDSFGAGAGQTLESIEVGDLSIYVEEGPQAVIAAVLRGVAPPELRAALQEALEEIHRTFGDRLASFSGDTTVFAGTTAQLELCLTSS